MAVLGALSSRARTVPQLPLGRWRFLLLGLAMLPCLALLYARNPEEEGLYPVCPFYFLTGLHCPGCGTLRSLHQLLNGNVIAALGYNPFSVLALPFILYAYFSALLLTTWGKRLPAPFIHPAIIWALLAAVLAFWALRNLPVFPFTALAP